MQRELSRTYRTIAAAFAGTIIVPILATAQQPHPAAIGDLMTAFVQPRHIKLGLAGNEQNWPYAVYELDQLRETFADLAEILPGRTLITRVGKLELRVPQDRAGRFSTELFERYQCRGQGFDPASFLPAQRAIQSALLALQIVDVTPPFQICHFVRNDAVHPQPSSPTEGGGY